MCSKTLDTTGLIEISKVVKSNLFYLFIISCFVDHVTILLTLMRISHNTVLSNVVQRRSLI